MPKREKIFTELGGVTVLIGTKKEHLITAINLLFGKTNELEEKISQLEGKITILKINQNEGNFGNVKID